MVPKEERRFRWPPPNVNMRVFMELTTRRNHQKSGKYKAKAAERHFKLLLSTLNFVLGSHHQSPSYEQRLPFLPIAVTGFGRDGCPPGRHESLTRSHPAPPPDMAQSDCKKPEHQHRQQGQVHCESSAKDGVGRDAASERLAAQFPVLGARWTNVVVVGWC